MCESINELAHLQINEFLYPYLAFRNANTIEVDKAWGLQWLFCHKANTFFNFQFSLCNGPSANTLFNFQFYVFLRQPLFHFSIFTFQFVLVLRRTVFSTIIFQVHHNGVDHFHFRTIVRLESLVFQIIYLCIHIHFSSFSFIVIYQTVKYSCYSRI